MVAVHEHPAGRRGLLAAAAAAAGLMAGYGVLVAGPLMMSAAILGIISGLVILRVPFLAVGLLIGLSAIIPFGVVPISVGPVTPGLVEIGLILVLALGLALLLMDRTTTMPVGGELAFWFIFAGFLVAAFTLGLGRGYTPETLHNFGKFGLGVLMFPATLFFIRDDKRARNVVALVMAGTGIAATIGLALYAGGASFSERVLARLIPYGYPSGRIVRYIEDDPARAMRAVGTSIDPNAFGGLLMIGFVLAIGQLVIRHRAVPAPLALAIASLTGVAMLLTYSRGAWVGAAAGMFIVLWFRAKIWFVPIGIAATLGFVAGIGSGFVERLWLGFTLQDPATQLRLQEYENALRIIERHPWFGVGFGSAPSLDLQTGVSSIYLTIAQQAGIIGLALFLTVVGIIVWRTAAQLFASRHDSSEDVAVPVAGTFASILTVGLVDHYFFNVEYAHMTALFWILAGLLVILRRSSTSLRSDQGRNVT